mgnify:CR=1 FL=1
MVEISNLCKSYGNKILFMNFNLMIPDNDFLVLTGASGCGKTTLLNMIGSLEKVDTGRIIVDGIDITDKKNQRRYLSQKVGFLFQNFVLIEDKTVEENLKIVKKINQSGVTINEALRQVGMLDAKRKKVYMLSGGEQQRIALARLMIKKCDLILCDEPTGSLDRNNAENIIKILKQMNKNGKTVIMVTHDESIKKVGKRMIKL